MRGAAMAEVKTDQPLKEFNTFGLDSRAERFCRVFSEKDLAELLRLKQLYQHGLFVLGAGSNVLLSGDLPGLTLAVAIPGIEIVSETDTDCLVRAGAGVGWHELVAWSVEQGLSGLESLALIPGSAGAAPVQNVGAYGCEAADVLEAVEGLGVPAGNAIRLVRAECRLGYRDSIFKHELCNKIIICRVYLRLRKRGPVPVAHRALSDELAAAGVASPKVKDIFDAVIRVRRRRLPDPARIGNAGSFFRNPIVPPDAADRIARIHPDVPSFPEKDGRVKLSAGWLIERAGFLGARRGRCGVYEKNALVLVNLGGATGAELLSLSSEIEESVRSMFGVSLEREVVVLP